MNRWMTVLVAMPLAASAIHAQESVRIRPSESQAQLTLEEVLSIGSLSGEHDAFGRVTGIAVDSRGRILVADERAHHFKVFGPSGAYLATVGRRGEGPGEFGAPRGIVVTPGDSVFVLDTDRSLISVFSPDHDWVRDVRISPSWQINSKIPRPDGTVVLASFARGDRFPVKVLGTDSEIERRAGIPIDPPDLYGFEASLLGGRLAQTGSGYVHTTKSPYMLTFLDEQLNTVRVCNGPRELTTDPADVVFADDRGAEIRWGDYVHSIAILPLREDRFLVAFIDPGDDWTRLHVVNEQCELVSELEVDVVLLPKVVQGDLVAVVRSTDYHEVVIFRVIMAGLGGGVAATRPLVVRRLPAPLE